MSALILGLQTSFEDVSTKPSTEVTIRVASRPYRDGSHQWLPRIAAGSDPEIRLAISVPWSNRRPAASYGAVDLANPDGALDSWMNGIWTGRSGELKVGYAHQPWEDWTLVAPVRMNHPEYIDGRILRLTFRDRIEDLDRPIQQHFFEAAPNEELNGQRRPMIIGQPWHAPALLWDEFSSDEIYYYVADGALPAFPDGAVREGLAPIFLGVGAQQYQLWPNGFRLNSQPTLPVTCFFSGPRYQPIPLPSSRFTQWGFVLDNGANLREVPVNWLALENFTSTVRYIARLSGTNYLEVKTSNSTGGWVRIGNDTAFKNNTAYRMHWKAVEDIAYDNALNVEIRVYTAPTGASSSAAVFSGNVDFLADDPIQFTTPNAGGVDLYVRLRFTRIAFGPDLTALFEAIWFEEVNEPAKTIDLLAPHLVCEKGIVDGDDETGPLSYQEVDHAALQTIAADLDVDLGHYWQDESTHRDLLDRIFRSMDSMWWISRQGKLTGARGLLSDDEPVLTFDDSNRTTKIEIIPTPVERLTDSFKFQRNYRPVREGEAAETVAEGEKAAGARDYRRQQRAGSAARLAIHPDYRSAIGAEPHETLITAVSGTANVDRADQRIEEHANRIWGWRIEGVLTAEEQAVLELKSKIRLISKRLGITEGRDVEAMDIRLLPVSGRVQIVARG